MKRYLILLILMIALVPVSAQKVYTSTQTVKEGENFKVKVYGSYFDSIAGIDLNIQFDPSVIKLNGISAGKNFSKCFKFNNINNTRGFGRVAIICGDARTFKNDLIAIYSFTALKGETHLHITASLSTSDFKTVYPETVDGSVKVLTKGSPDTGSASTGSSGLTDPANNAQNGVQPTVQPTQQPVNTVQPAKTEQTPIAEQTQKPKSQTEQKTSSPASHTTPTAIPTTTEIATKSTTEEKLNLKNIPEIPGFEVCPLLIAALISAIRSRKS
ncbi:hypothetical protein Asulf_02180 [Archaeoglobus sulfaticallidus PM70-1]|uniref:Cohesin domain-containing protein n=1 Tax=Archaeoglobus sulfaticallidus PM70-1 TaxID=387631 RepID=N0BGK1_9EURY|nr:cohesin domain-containing protein [Archaeoglobus sulfaticallidus]AGK62133.1 hypothetical protein Asulf_02180 [Archaeoglobus sulfaticallidus PM70-1]